jgi:hypothetical protein
VRKIILSGSIVLLSLSSTLALAGGYNYEKEDMSGYNLQPSLKVSEESEYNRTGHELYFFGGYVYTHRFLSDNAKTIHNLNGTLGSYIPSDAVPANFNGLQIGMGKALSTHFDFQASYIQDFEADKTSNNGGNSYLYKVKANSLLGDVAYIFNPYDQFQVLLQVGAMLTQITNTISVNSAPYYTVSDSTKIDPAAGLEFLMKFTQNLGVRMGALYVAETQGTNSHGQLDGILSLNYTV